MMLKMTLALFLILHGAIHGVIALLQEPEPEMSPAQTGVFWHQPKWLYKLNPQTTKMLMYLLAVVVPFAFIVSGVGLLGGASWGFGVAVAAILASAGLLAVFVDKYMVGGLLIDVVLLVVLLLVL